MTTNIIPHGSSTIYKAAAYINEAGPMPAAELLAKFDFGARTDHREKLNHAYEIGWLQQTPAGLVDLTERAKQHFAPAPKPEPYVGQVAPPAYRGNVFAGQGLSKRYIPNRRGPRADVPAWSVREILSFQTKA